MNLDAVYNRPFPPVKKTPVALGGYVEANWQHVGTDGITWKAINFKCEGSRCSSHRVFISASNFCRRLSLKTAPKKSTSSLLRGCGISSLAKYARRCVDESHQGIQSKSRYPGGVVDRPTFNTNAPHLEQCWLWFVHGKRYKKNWVYAYEVYLSNGFDDKNYRQCSEQKSF